MRSVAMTNADTNRPSTQPPPRAATPADWERIASLLRTSALPVDGAQEHLEGFVVAERDGELVGCAAVERHGDAGILRSVAVRAGERGRGIGALLVERCIADAMQSGITELVLLTTTAERYFPRFGFVVVDRADVPPAVQTSAEFRGACPASAIVMAVSLSRRNDCLTVRPANRNDASAIAAIYNTGIRGRTATFETRERSAMDIDAWFANDRYPILVAERGGRVVGWIAASSYRPRDCYAGIAEFSVYVESAQQRRGVGDTLMREFLPILEHAGFWKVLSRIFPENLASRALCRRHGFREVGVYEKHACLDGTWRDVVIVERLIGVAANLPTSM